MSHEGPSFLDDTRKQRLAAFHHPFELLQTPITPCRILGTLKGSYGPFARLTVGSEE